MSMTMKEEFTAHDMATAAARGFRDGQRASAELAATLSRSMSKAITGLPKRLRIKASMIALGERIAWGSDTALMEEAADVIEALIASVENHQLHMLGMARDRDQLRAMLSEQPQSAPAGEREAFEAWAASVGYHTERDMFQREKYQSTLTWELWRVWQARAAQQRTQSAGVPDALREAVEYLDDNPFNEIGAGSILHRAMRDALAAAPAQPAARQEPVVHASAGCIACEGSPESNNNPCHVCGGTVSAAHDQGEVQRMREALEVVHERFGPCRDEFAFSKRNALDKVSAALSASTGQEAAGHEQ